MDIVIPVEESQPSNKTVASRYVRILQSDFWHVVVACVVNPTSDLVVGEFYYLGGVVQVREQELPRGLYRIHTVYAMTVWLVYATFLCTPLTESKFAAGLLAGNVAMYTISLTVTAPTAIISYQGVLFPDEIEIKYYSP
jgi:hypothetical protein